MAIAAPAVLVAAQVASAATWNFQATAVASGATTWQLSGVSCQDDGECIAAGSYTDSSGFNHVLAEERQGATWTQLSTAEPAGATSSTFNAISCPGQTSCVAVGDYVNGSGQLPLVEHWYGDSFSVDDFPTPPGAVTSELTGVFCPVTDTCLAVGEYSDSPDGNAPTMFAAIWRDPTWTLLTPAIPSGSVASGLSGVSCTSVDACVVVGGYNKGSGGLSLAEAWNGSTWTEQATPSTEGQLNGVSCTTSSACTAVGAGGALRWNGAAWAQQTIAKPHPGNLPDLLSVTCTSPQTCTAVGTYFVAGVEYPATEFWNGTVWKFQAISLTDYDTAYLSGLSCRSLVTCTAVGSYQDPVDGYRSFAETIVVQWQVQTTQVPLGVVSSGMEDVSCPSGTVCVALAWYIGSKPGLNAFTEFWNGTSWTDGTIPNPTVTQLNALSCLSATACTAVGDDTSNNGVLPLVARWNGTGWTEQDVPLPTGETTGVLSGVACVTATACVAVGTANNASDQADAIAEVWNGSTWTLHIISASAGSSAQGVSCATATACTAVGTTATSSLAAKWNGSTWTVQTTADPAGSTFAILYHVSCPAASHCLAVGSYDNSASHRVMLAEVWNGSRWTLHRPPALPATTASGLSSVSCSSVTACTTVGDSIGTGKSVDTLLSERWDGTSWTDQAISPPSGTQGGSLTGVSCPSVVDCTAVGSAAAKYSAALAEQFS